MRTYALAIAAWVLSFTAACHPDGSSPACGAADCEHGMCAGEGAATACLCMPGWTGPSCTDDVDECLGTSACRADQRCENRAGDYLCIDEDPIEPECEPGYESVGTECEDIDECLDEPCSAQAACTNLPGSYACECPAGYERDGDSCFDIDECATTAPCAFDEFCQNLEGSFACAACDEGYVKVGNKCEDVDECADSTFACDPHASCVNWPGSFTCECDEGYRADGHSCIDIDECFETPSCRELGQTCTNTDGGFTCGCAPGFTASGEQCADVDECVDQPGLCGQNALCTNVVGGFECACRDGFALRDGVCADIDECSDPQRCHALASCTNLEGSFTCRCREGYEGDGKSCADIDECARPDACTTRALCTNTPGAHSCACAEGYVGDGQSCTSIAECDGGAPCGSHAHCEYVGGATACLCDSGWDGDAASCERASIVQIAVSEGRTTALRSDGSLLSWGHGFPQVPADKGFVQVTSSCGLHDSGKVSCWGGWQSPGGTFVRLVDEQVFSSSQCGVRTDGRIACWGWVGPTLEFPSGDWRQVLSTRVELCALDAGGALTCWPEHDQTRQVSVPGTFLKLYAADQAEQGRSLCALDTEGHALCRRTDGLYSPLGAERFTHLAVHTRSTCGLRGDGSVLCSGLSGGELTAGADGESFEQLVATYDFMCGERADGSLHCWDPDGATGDLGPGAHFAKVSAGRSHVCGLREDGRVECLGANGAGQAQLPGTEPYGRLALAIGDGWSAQSATACGSLESGRTFCIGGQLGELPADSFVSLAEHSRGRCGLRSDGSVSCMGENAELAPPVEDNFVQLVAGYRHFCALRDDGTTTCWGDNTWGHLQVPPERFREIRGHHLDMIGLREDGSAVVTWGARRVTRPAPRPYVKFYASIDFWCGLMDDERAHCATFSALSTVTAPADERFTQLALGGAHACGLRADGSVRCWGSNSYLQLEPPSAERFVRLDASHDHTCGTRADGRVQCWGGGHSDGQQKPARDVPLDALTLGSDHTCGLDADGALECWGWPTVESTWTDPPEHERFGQILGACGVRIDGTAILCWGDRTMMFPIR